MHSNYSSRNRKWGEIFFARIVQKILSFMQNFSLLKDTKSERKLRLIEEDFFYCDSSFFFSLSL